MCPDILEPFHKLMRKDEKWYWSSECMLAFSKCKTALSEAAILTIYDPSKELILSVDSSSFGVGAILSQVINGEERPIAFESATLSQSQRNYSQLDKEALAIIFGVKKFHKYLWGRNFTICSDHVPLKTIFGENKRIPVMASSRLIRWSMILSTYNYYKIIHKKGTLIPHADAFSRLPSSCSIDEHEVLFTYLSTPLIDVNEVREHTSTDKVLSEVIKYVLNGFPGKIDDTNLKVYERNKCSLSVANDCLYFSDRMVIPSSLRKKVLNIIHSNHAGLVRSKLLARSYVWWPGLDNDIYHSIILCLVTFVSLLEINLITNTVILGLLHVFLGKEYTLICLIFKTISIWWFVIPIPNGSNVFFF
jgi:hypothetical protein